MTFEIGNIIKGYLEPLRVGGSGNNPFIDKLAGVVKTIVKIDKGDVSSVRSFPISCDLDFDSCVSSGRYKDLMPDSKVGCIVYLEDLGARLVDGTQIKKQWKASYRLVCWINQKKLGVTDCSITAKMVNTIISKFPQVPVNIGIYQRLSIDVLGQESKSSDPFSKYNYDEEKTQYKMYPFDYFSLLIDVDFYMDVRCIVEFEKQTEINCNN